MSRAELYQQFKILIMLKNQQKEFLKEIDRLNSSAQKCKEKVREMEDYLQKKIYKEITTFPFVFQS